jgi:hypothetical protein
VATTNLEEVMMDTKGIVGMGLALMLVAGGASLSMVSVAQADSKGAKTEANDKKELKQGEKPADSEEGKTRGFKKGQKPTETMGTMGKQKDKGESKP